MKYFTSKTSGMWIAQWNLTFPFFWHYSSAPPPKDNHHWLIFPVFVLSYHYVYSIIMYIVYIHVIMYIVYISNSIYSGVWLLLLNIVRFTRAVKCSYRLFISVSLPYISLSQFITLSILLLTDGLNNVSIFWYLLLSFFFFQGLSAP